MKKNVKKVASIIELSNEETLILWLKTLPCHVTQKQTQALIEEIKENRIVVLWTSNDGFTVWSAKL